MANALIESKKALEVKPISAPGPQANGVRPCSGAETLDGHPWRSNPAHLGYEQRAD